MNASCISTHSIVKISVRALTLMWLLFPLVSLGQSTSQGNSLVPAFTLEDGTPIKLRLSRTISSAEESVGNEVDFDVLEEVRISDRLVIPKGSLALGTVTVAQEKRRMGHGGKLDINIDSVRLANGQKAALRAVKNTKGGGHVGAMTGAIVATSLVFWPAAPFFLMMHGKDITIPKGTEITAYVNGNMNLDPTRFGGLAATQDGTATPLDAPAKAAMIAITSTPAGAEISVDHNFVGNTPSSVAVSGGEHVVSVRKNGFNDWEREIKVSGGTVSLSADLTPGSTKSSVVGTTVASQNTAAAPRSATRDKVQKVDVETASGWIGLSTEPQGIGRLAITQVVSNGPAARGGLEVGDIVVGLNGRPVTSGQDFDTAVAACKPGSKLQVSYLRRAWQLQATVMVGDGTNP